MSEFRKLKVTGLLRTIYPDTPLDYEHRPEVKAIEPLPDEQIDWTSVKSMVNGHVNEIIIDPNREDEDFEHYLYEQVMTVMFGGNKFFEWKRELTR